MLLIQPQISTTYSQRLVVTSQVTSQTDGWVHHFIEEQQRNSGGTSVLLLPHLAPGQACGCPQQTPLGWQGRPPCRSGEVGEGSTGLTASPRPALQPHQHLNACKQHCCFCLMILPLRAPVTDTQSCTLLGPAAEENIKNGVVPYVMKHTLLGTAACSQLGSAGTFGDAAPLLCCAVSAYWPGIPTPWAFQSCSRRRSHSCSDQLLALNISPPQLLNAQTRRA